MKNNKNITGVRNEKALEELFNYLEKRKKAMELEEKEFKNKILLKPKYTNLVLNENN